MFGQNNRVINSMIRIFCSNSQLFFQYLNPLKTEKKINFRKNWRCDAFRLYFFKEIFFVVDCRIFKWLIIIKCQIRQKYWFWLFVSCTFWTVKEQQSPRKTRSLMQTTSTVKSIQSIHIELTSWIRENLWLLLSNHQTIRSILTRSH